MADALASGGRDIAFWPSTVSRPSHLAVPEEFTDSEAAVLRRHFTNIDKPVFALMNLPEVVKGALFARYSRSPLSLRRLFLNEFVDDLDDLALGAERVAAVGQRRAEGLYDRVFFEYGDDSVAQLGGAHIACEQASNLLTKVLERGRLMSYLEQSTRYIVYDCRLNGRFRYSRPPAVMESPLGARYVGDLDLMFESYAELVRRMRSFFRKIAPKAPSDSDFAYRKAIRARALDAVRGMLPAATLANVGIYGSGQSYEALLLRMRANPLPEARYFADMMLTELRKVIPSFLRRVDLADRGEIASRYLSENQAAMDDLAGRVFGEFGGRAALSGPAEGAAREVVDLVDFDPDAERKMIAAMLLPHTSLAERDVLARVDDMTTDERLAVIRAYCGTRSNRRHKPGRALERSVYRFDVLSDYGAFRDLQRHRMLTIEWQPLSTRHGYVMPDQVADAGAAGDFEQVMEISADLYEALFSALPDHAAYAVALAYRVRYVMQLNAREAMHMLELRTGEQGNPAYRRVCQRMHRLIEDQAGHPAVAAMMSFVNHSREPALGRLQAESRAEERARLRQ